MNFKIHDCKVGINFYFFATLAVLAWYDRGGMITGSMIAALLHECGHLSAMFYFSEQTPSVVTLTPFGMRIKSLPTAEFAKGRIPVVLAGSLVNFITAVCSINFASKFASINFVMGFINLLPIETLDGGAFLRNLLGRMISEKTASWLVAVISIIFLIITSFIGVRILFATKYNFSLLGMSLWMLTAIVIRLFRNK